MIIVKYIQISFSICQVEKGNLKQIILHQRKKYCDGYLQAELSDTRAYEIDSTMSTSMLEKTPSMAVLEVKSESSIPRKIFLTPKPVFNLKFLTRNAVASSTFKSPTNLQTSLMPEQLLITHSSSTTLIDSFVSPKIETTQTTILDTTPSEITTSSINSKMASANDSKKVDENDLSLTSNELEVSYENSSVESIIFVVKILQYP